MSRYWIHKEGFTFIEIMVSLTIISTLLIVIIGSLNYHLSLLDRQKTLTIANLLAKEKIREVKKTLKAEKGNFSEPNSAFTFDVQIKDSDYPNMLEITVKVFKGNDTAIVSELTEKKT